MSIKDLIEAAKTTKVTSKQVANLRVQLALCEKERCTKFTRATGVFLGRTYNI